MPNRIATWQAPRWAEEDKVDVGIVDPVHDQAAELITRSARSELSGGSGLAVDIGFRS
jgi:hypothetical protein